jgi:hypothetical protein
MNQFVESLYRLYSLDKVHKEQLSKLLANKKINQQEYDYIISAKEVV